MSLDAENIGKTIVANNQHAWGDLGLRREEKTMIWWSMVYIEVLVLMVLKFSMFSLDRDLGFEVIHVRTQITFRIRTS